MHPHALSSLGFLVIVLLAAGPAQAAPTVLTVDTTAQRDGADDLPSNCTLGDALVAANGDVAVDACFHPNLGSGGPFEIVLPEGTGPYVLELSEPGTGGGVGLPVVLTDVTLLGNGNAIERHDAFACPDPAGNDFRLIEVAAGARLVVEDLELRNGCAPDGGAIRNAGRLVLDGAIVSENVALSGDGGAIVNEGGDADLIDTSVTDNQASGDGGGIYNAPGAVLVLQRSTIAGNTASSGGGVANFISDATFLNSTVSSNVATDGGAVSNSGGASLTLLNSTVAANQATRGPGLFNRNGTMNFANTVLVDRCFFERSPGNTDAGHNLERFDSCGLNAASSSVNLPTGLGRLQDNGGMTATHAPSAASPVVDAGDAATCGLAGVDGIDQRGFERPDGAPASGGSCDIGAVEYVDCDGNGLDDGSELTADPALDADGNGVLDVCEDQPPVAVAGPDQNLECSSGTGADVLLDGSGSSDPEGGPLSYEWAGPFGAVSGATASVVMPLGSAPVALLVTDDGGNTASDELTVTVQDATPPSASAGLERLAINGEFDELQVQASCSDRCDSGIVPVADLDGAPVAAGEVVQVRGFTDEADAPFLTVRCVDGSGNASEASAAAPAREPEVEPPEDDPWSRWWAYLELLLRELLILWQESYLDFDDLFEDDD